MKTNKPTWLLIAAISAMLPFAAVGVQAATNTTNQIAAAESTRFDTAIDLYVRQMVGLRGLPAADALVLREQLQMQFNSLSRAQQAKVLSAARRYRQPRKCAGGCRRHANGRRR